MLRISSLYYFMFCVSLIFKQYCYQMVDNKINQTIELINESLIYSCVSYYGLIESNETLDSKYLYLNQEKTKQLVDLTINENLKMSTNKIEYYFYDFSNIQNTFENFDYCNSVQIKITINYHTLNYEKIFFFIFYSTTCFFEWLIIRV